MYVANYNKMTGNNQALYLKFCFMGVLYLGLTTAVQADYRILHHFTGGASDGAGPAGSLIQSGTILYGMTRVGGVNDIGTIFRINTDGTGFQVLHNFSGSDGRWPLNSLTVSGSVLYGMTTFGGTHNFGTVFRINTDGTDFQMLHSFLGGSNGGCNPHGALILSGSTLYGATTIAGRSNLGTVFTLNTDGTGFRLLHSFTGGSNDGKWPYFATLTRSGSVLFGMTQNGGPRDRGIVFRMNIDTADFAVLHGFAGGPNDGALPMGSPILSGSVLYGGTISGGGSDAGTVFKLNADGTGFQILHSFTGGDGRVAYHAPVPSGTILYGVTAEGGSYNHGTIFALNTDGTGFQVLHDFAGGSNDGAQMMGYLVLAGPTLYGMTSAGGSQNKGVIFSFDLPQTRLVPDEHPTIQGAIDAAGTGDVIHVAQGIYYENISLIDKNMVLRSVNPDDPYYIGGTIIQGDVNEPVLTLDNNSDACEIAGLTLRAGTVGISGSTTNATIRNCRIMDNVTDGIELSQQSSPHLLNCLITANGETGIKMLDAGRGNPPCKPIIENCVIVDNGRAAIEGGEPVIIESIIQQ